MGTGAVKDTDGPGWPKDSVCVGRWLWRREPEKCPSKFSG